MGWESTADSEPRNGNCLRTISGRAGVDICALSSISLKTWKCLRRSCAKPFPQNGTGLRERFFVTVGTLVRSQWVWMSDNDEPEFIIFSSTIRQMGRLVLFSNLPIAARISSCNELIRIFRYCMPKAPDPVPENPPTRDCRLRLRLPRHDNR